METASLLAELAASRGWFETWQTPADFARRLSELTKKTNSEIYFNRGQAKWLQHAWIVNQYAKFTIPLRLRLNPTDPPDAFVELAKNQIPIEITEVMEPGRKRGNEYRNIVPGSVEHDPVENWVKRAEAILPALREGLRRKSLTQYEVGTQLLIYLNISQYDIQQKKLEAEILSLISADTGPFALINVLWKNNLLISTGEVFGPQQPDEYD